MASARVNSKGEITLPKSVLERLGVKTGDQVEFVGYGQGIVLLRLCRSRRNPSPSRP